MRSWLAGIEALCEVFVSVRLEGLEGSPLVVRAMFALGKTLVTGISLGFLPLILEFILYVFLLDLSEASPHLWYEYSTVKPR